MVTANEEVATILGLNLSFLRHIGIREWQMQQFEKVF
jgi:hypothetical protein